MTRLLADALVAVIYLVVPAAAQPAPRRERLDEPVDVVHRMPASRLYWLLVGAAAQVAGPDDDPEDGARWVMREIDLRGIEALARPAERTH